jgi:hypothetical protein
MREPADGEGQLYTLGLLERVRAECKDLWGTSSKLYFRVDELLRELADPNLHDVPTNLPFRVEMWDRHDKGIRWVVSASSSEAIGHAAFDMAIANYPGDRFTLRNGALVIREHKPNTSIYSTRFSSSIQKERCHFDWEPGHTDGFGFHEIKFEWPLDTNPIQAWVYLAQHSPHRYNMMRAEVITREISRLRDNTNLTADELRCRLHYSSISGFIV